jgi:CRP-like cAMP-binding protein
MVPSTRRALACNHLLQALPSRDRQQMLDGCESVQLDFGDVVYVPEHPIEHVHFPTASFISLIMPIDDAACLEVGMVGCEGMFGIPLALGVDVSPVRAVVQGAGPALRMEAARFRSELARSPPLRRAMGRYVVVHMNQLAQTAACTRFHVVESRLARWLLMTQDRAQEGTFHVTHEFLAFMLGVRRVGVTKAASALQRRGLIRYSRGDVTVLDRRGLKAASCSCYKADRDAYDRVLGQAMVR